MIFFLSPSKEDPKMAHMFTGYYTQPHNVPPDFSFQTEAQRRRATEQLEDFHRRPTMRFRNRHGTILTQQNTESNRNTLLNWLRNSPALPENQFSQAVSSAPSSVPTDPNIVIMDDIPQVREPHPGGKAPPSLRSRARGGMF